MVAKVMETLYKFALRKKLIYRTRCQYPRVLPDASAARFIAHTSI